MSTTEERAAHPLGIVTNEIPPRHSYASSLPTVKTAAVYGRASVVRAGERFMLLSMPHHHNASITWFYVVSPSEAHFSNPQNAVSWNKTEVFSGFVNPLPPRRFDWLRRRRPQKTVPEALEAGLWELQRMEDEFCQLEARQVDQEKGDAEKRALAEVEVSAMVAVERLLDKRP